VNLKVSQSMKMNPELYLLTYADELQLVPREKPPVDPMVLSAVWGGKGSGQSKPTVWKTSTTSSTLRTDSPEWKDSTTS
jgi:hypothetical protein